MTARIFSDDHEKNWHRGDTAIPDTEKWISPNETLAVQLVDAGVMFNGRTLAKEIVALAPKRISEPNSGKDGRANVREINPRWNFCQ